MSKVKFIFTFWLCVFYPLVAEGAETLRIAFLTAEEKQVQALVHTIEEFEQDHSQYKVEIKTFTDSVFKANIDSWLESGEFDIVHWQAGKRLFRYVNAGRVAPLNNYLDLIRVKNNFNTNALNQLSKDGKLYGLPLATYVWGFYYNKSLFKSLNLSPPKTLNDFFDVAEQLHKESVKPLIQANAESWETLGWLDYLSLNAGGVELRKKLTNGESLSEQQVVKLLQPLEVLASQDYFFAPEHSWSWVQAIASVGRGLAGMTLSGQFAEDVLIDRLDTRVGFFPFPESQQHGTVAPLDLLMIPSTSKNKLAASAFLTFLSDKKISAKLSQGLGWLPTAVEHIRDKNTSERINHAMSHIESSKFHVQYFDRDTETERAQLLDEYIGLLLTTKDLKPLMKYLEGK